MNRELFQVAAYCAAPRQRLVHADAVLKLPLRMFVAPPASELVGCCVCEFFEKLVVQVRRPERPRLRDADVLNLRVEPLDPDAEVLLERQLDGVVDRQAADRFGWPAGWPPARGRLRGGRLAEDGLSGLSESGHRGVQERSNANGREFADAYWAPSKTREPDQSESDNNKLLCRRSGGDFRFRQLYNDRPFLEDFMHISPSRLTLRVSAAAIALGHRAGRPRPKGAPTPSS